MFYQIEIIYYRTINYISTKLGNIKRFLINSYHYRHALMNDYPYGVNLKFLQKSIERTCNYIENYGHEEDISRLKLKKINAMKRAIYLLNVHNNDTYLQEAENILNIKYQYTENFMECFEKLPDGNYLYKGNPNKQDDENNTKLINLSHKLEEDYWNELFFILKGKEITDYNNWDQEYDGSDLRRW